MEMSEQAWHLVKDTPEGHRLHRQPDAAGGASRRRSKTCASGIVEGAVKPKPRLTFEEGDEVRVIDGAFANFSGTVEEVKPDKQKLKVKVSASSGGRRPSSSTSPRREALTTLPRASRSRPIGRSTDGSAQ